MSNKKGVDELRRANNITNNNNLMKTQGTGGNTSDINIYKPKKG